MNFPFRLPEIDAVERALSQCDLNPALEIGAGSGTLTASLAGRCRPVVTERFNDEWPRLKAIPAQVVQSEPDRLPFPDRSFATVMCTQVVDHLQADTRRRDVIAEIGRVLRPGGRAIITARHQNHRFDNFGLAKEGYSDGVYYHRFYLPEFRELLETALSIESVWGLWVYLPKTYPIYTRLGPAVVYWERALRKSSLSLRYGKIFLAVCRPRPQ